jgi:hypothetical protein
VAERDRWHDLIVILDDVLFVARHDSQIARLEQVTRALAESHAETEATTRDLSRQWQAYLNTLRKELRVLGSC